MSRTAIITLLTLWVALSSPALAQIGLRTAKPKIVPPEETTQETPAGPRAQPAPVRRSITRMNVTSTEAEEDCKVLTGWLPLRETDSDETLVEKARCFWNQEDQDYLKYGRFVSSSKTISATTEIISDAFGPVRVALSTAVATPTEDDEEDEGETEDAKDGEDEEPTSEQDEALNLLAANGGNLALTASYPIYFRPLLSDGSFLWNSYLRIATNVSALGGNTESTVDFGEVNGNVELAFTEMQLDLLSYEKSFNLLGYLKTSAIFGSDKFAETLHPDASRNFFHGQVGAGMRIGQILMVYATYNWYSDSDIPGEGGAVTFAMTRSQP